MVWCRPDVGGLFVYLGTAIADTQDGGMMNWNMLANLEWSHPWWVLLALQPLLMALLLKLRRNQVLHYADTHLLAWAVRGSEGRHQPRWNGLLIVAAWLLLACAAAGPRLPLIAVDNTQPETQRHEMDIMVLLDVSPSMQARDMSPQRLQRAKLELLDLLPRLQGERLGLIAFSGSAGLIMPLSRDYNALRYYLNIAEPGLFDTPGTAIGTALELAIRQLPPQQFASRAILMLTDAEAGALSGPAGAAVWEAADKLKAAGIKLYILGVGTASGSTIPQENGSLLVNEGVEVISSMDQSGFSELASKTGGKFVQVEDGEGDWRSLYDQGLLTQAGGKPSTENVLAWQEMYALFLLPSLMLFTWIYIPFRLKKIQPLAIAVLAGVLLATSDVHEASAAEVDAYAAYRNKNYTQAQTLYGEQAGYGGRMGEGAAAYRRKDYQYAIKQFSNALLEARNDQQRERALFNLGNSYFMATGYRAAADAFMGVLRYAPDNNDARANLALTAGILAQISKAGKKSQGISGRRGREIGGAMGVDAADQPLSMDATDDKNNSALRAGSNQTEMEKALLASGGKPALSSAAGSQIEGEITYRAALKKLELATDNPVPLHKSLIKIEAAREYMPQVEMSPW
jgi:Ca-activated chloride channel family protein